MKLLKPSDCYFQIFSLYGKLYITIALKDFFEKNGTPDDQFPPIDNIIPNDFLKHKSSIWICGRTREEINKDMISRGFIQKELTPFN